MLASHHLIWWFIWCDISSCLYHVVLMGCLKMQNHVQFCTKKTRIFWWNQGDVCVTYSVFRAVSEVFGSSIWYLHVFTLFLYVFRCIFNIENHDESCFHCFTQSWLMLVQLKSFPSLLRGRPRGWRAKNSQARRRSVGIVIGTNRMQRTSEDLIYD